MAKLSDFTKFVIDKLDVHEKCEILMDVINKTLEDFESGALKDGTESLSFLLEEVLEKLDFSRKTSDSFGGKLQPTHPIAKDHFLFQSMCMTCYRGGFAMDSM